MRIICTCKTTWLYNKIPIVWSLILHTMLYTFDLLIVCKLMILRYNLKINTFYYKSTSKIMSDVALV